MEQYDFAVLKGAETIAATRSALPDPRAAWSRVAELAENVDEPGCLIRVTNEAGEVLILVGVAAARGMAADVAARGRGHRKSALTRSAEPPSSLPTRQASSQDRHSPLTAAATGFDQKIFDRRL